MPRSTIAETDLYPPIRDVLIAQGYEVKGEVGAADIVALRDGDAPVIVELKTGFALTLFHQAIARQTITDHVYIAVPRGTGRVFAASLKQNLGLCRRLGLGLITVRLKDGTVEIHLDPAPYHPRKSKQKTARLLREFAKRSGDPTAGGSTRAGLMTAYRQDALRCLHHLATHADSTPKDIKTATGVENARNILAHNHYGWFERVSRGVYTITDKGQQAAKTYAGDIKALTKR